MPSTEVAYSGQRRLRCPIRHLVFTLQGLAYISHSHEKEKDEQQENRDLLFVRSIEQ